ncbi:hypothetical protein LTR85_009304 [Meristemomyces frigidus]|nr:hypothetical protein LTR85_009304 [Meristemomyces frigidus]
MAQSVLSFDPQEQPRVRRSFRDVEKDHFVARQQGSTDRTELETLVLAWLSIQEDLDPKDPNSFFTIGGYHGEPFRGVDTMLYATANDLLLTKRQAGWSNSMWWGGYCYHNQILFPTWHRAYVYRLENALRSVKGCQDLTLPFLDWCDSETIESGLPITFCQKEIALGDGTVIRNPLYSYVFQAGVFDSLGTFPDTEYSKPLYYETVRYPLSGLVGLPKTDQASTTATYNATWEYPTNLQPLNDNITSWLKLGVELHSGKTVPIGIAQKFRECLDAPNYVVFSNVSSASQYNQDNLQGVGTGQGPFVPLESPHNSMHLAVGGYHIPNGPLNTNSNPGDPVPDNANGDMVWRASRRLCNRDVTDGEQGENDTAAFDPIFYFHHCFVDRMFWLWQQKHKQTTKLVIEAEYQRYPGTNNFDGQGPTPGRPAGTWLDLDTPLEPFVKTDGSSVKSTDVADIEGSLGYTYGPGSFTDKHA